MRFPNDAELKALRERYPAGTRIRLIHMADDIAPGKTAYGASGKITGSIKRFENGLAPVGVDGITHAAEVTFDNGFTFRREIVGGEYGNKTNYFINGNSVSNTNVI